MPKAQPLISGEALEIKGEFEVGKNSTVLIRLQAGAGETLIGYDRAKQVLFIDRTKSGEVNFDANFPGRHEAPLSTQQSKVTLHIFVDRSSVEVFGNDGLATITDRIFPPSANQRVELSSFGADVKCRSINVWKLKSVWRH